MPGSPSESSEGRAYRAETRRVNRLSLIRLEPLQIVLVHVDEIHLAGTEPDEATACGKDHLPHANAVFVEHIIGRLLAKRHVTLHPDRPLWGGGHSSAWEWWLELGPILVIRVWTRHAKRPAAAAP